MHIDIRLSANLSIQEKRQALNGMDSAFDFLGAIFLFQSLSFFYFLLEPLKDKTNAS